MKKLLVVIVALVGFGGVAGVVVIVLLAPRYLEDVDLRCTVEMQLA